MERSPSTDKLQPLSSVQSGEGIDVTPDIYGLTVQFANVYMISNPSDPKKWVLFDAGTPGSAEVILSEAADRFGEDHQLQAVVLSHGHFDHVGGLIGILEKYPAPVYAHPEELPHLTGKKDYPRPDPTVEGGLIAKMSPEFPTEAIDISEHVKALPEDGTIPELPEWTWYHTPGHSFGHISLFRERDRALIVGDAFLTVKQDSLPNVTMQERGFWGPPVYLTPEWEAAKKSVQKLRELEPEIAAPGHGLPAMGEELKEGLADLADHFDEKAKPDYGRFVDDE